MTETQLYVYTFVYVHVYKHTRVHTQTHIVGPCTMLGHQTLYSKKSTYNLRWPSTYADSQL